MSTSTADRETLWERFWFVPEPALALTIIRAIVFAVAAVVLLDEVRKATFRSVADAGDIWQPVSYYGLLPLPPGWLLVGGAVVAIGLCVAAVAGRGGRWVTLPGGVLAAYLIGITNNLGKVNHGANVLVMALFVLAFAPATGWRRPADASWRYRWPVAAVQIGFALMLALATFSKLRESGLTWVFSENLRNIIISENLLFRTTSLPDVALWVASEPWRWQIAAAMTMIGEGCLLVGILSRRPWIRLPCVALAAGLLMSLNLLLNLGGWTHTLLLLALLDWGWIIRTWSRHAVVISAGVLGFAVAIGLTVASYTPRRSQWSQGMLAVGLALAALIAISRQAHRPVGGESPPTSPPSEPAAVTSR